MRQAGDRDTAKTDKIAGGLAGWMLARLRGARQEPPRLVVLERIALAPRQSLALVRAEGRCFLVATSPEGTPAFYALDDAKRRPGAKPDKGRESRVSW